MKIFVQTPRLTLRELQFSDAVGMFEMDSDPEVHKYLGTKPFVNIKQSREQIEFVRNQYKTNGIGRWAVTETSSGLFLGWSGLKLVKDPVNSHILFYDVGYRFMRKHWGKGYATESAKAAIKYGFEVLKLKDIFGIVDIKNDVSKKVLEKAGLSWVETFEFEGEQTDWYQIENTKHGL